MGQTGCYDSNQNVSTALNTVHLIKENVGKAYLFEDFLLLVRGESLWVEREDASLEYERSERSDLSDRSERGEDERPRLLLLRVGLGEPL